MESSINCEQNGNGIWLDLFIWLTGTEHNTAREDPHTALGGWEITKLKERRGWKAFVNKQFPSFLEIENADM